MGVLGQYPRITPFLWFDTNAEEAVAFYMGVFENSRVLKLVRVPAGGPGPEGAAMTIAFELDGQKFTALNGGPHFKFTEAISFAVRCTDQAEIDYYWEKLSADGGTALQCGWLKDKFGLSWQVVPAQLGELVSNPKAMQAMMRMKKLIVAELEEAVKS